MVNTMPTNPPLSSDELTAIRRLLKREGTRNAAAILQVRSSVLAGILAGTTKPHPTTRLVVRAALERLEE